MALGKSQINLRTTAFLEVSKRGLLLAMTKFQGLVTLVIISLPITFASGEDSQCSRVDTCLKKCRKEPEKDKKFHIQCKVEFVEENVHCQFNETDRTDMCSDTAMKEHCWPCKETARVQSCINNECFVEIRCKRTLLDVAGLLPRKDYQVQCNIDYVEDWNCSFDGGITSDPYDDDLCADPSQIVLNCRQPCLNPTRHDEVTDNVVNVTLKCQETSSLAGHEGWTVHCELDYGNGKICKFTEEQTLVDAGLGPMCLGNDHAISYCGQPCLETNRQEVCFNEVCSIKVFCKPSLLGMFGPEARDMNIKCNLNYGQGDICSFEEKGTNTDVILGKICTDDDQAQQHCGKPCKGTVRVEVCNNSDCSVTVECQSLLDLPGHVSRYEYNITVCELNFGNGDICSFNKTEATPPSRSDCTDANKIKEECGKFCNEIFRGRDLYEDFFKWKIECINGPNHRCQLLFDRGEVCDFETKNDGSDPKDICKDQDEIMEYCGKTCKEVGVFFACNKGVCIRRSRCLLPPGLPGHVSSNNITVCELNFGNGDICSFDKMEATPPSASDCTDASKIKEECGKFCNEIFRDWDCINDICKWKVECIDGPKHRCQLHFAQGEVCDFETKNDGSDPKDICKDQDQIMEQCGKTCEEKDSDMVCNKGACIRRVNCMPQFYFQP